MHPAGQLSGYMIARPQAAPARRQRSPVFLNSSSTSLQLRVRVVIDRALAKAGGLLRGVGVLQALNGHLLRLDVHLQVLRRQGAGVRLRSDGTA